MSEPYQVEATADGATASIHLPTGIFALEIKADAWDGASATLQEGYGSVFSDSDDPYNTGNALTRTANGKIIERVIEMPTLKNTRKATGTATSKGVTK